MKRTFARVVLPIMVLSLFLASCDFISGIVNRFMAGEERAVWQDPKGDAPDKRYPQSNGSVEILPALDIVEVSVAGTEGAIKADFKISGLFDTFFSRVDSDGKIHNMSMVELYIDTDNSTSTGGTPAASKDSPRPLEGYDVYIAATPSIKYKDKKGTQGAVSGDTFIDTNKQEMTGYSATYFIRKVPAGDKAVEFNTRTWHENKRDYTSISGDLLQIRVPYEWLGLKAGDTIRLCYKEMGQGAGSGLSFSEDKYLELK